MGYIFWGVTYFMINWLILIVVKIVIAYHDNNEKSFDNLSDRQKELIIEYLSDENLQDNVKWWLLLFGTPIVVFSLIRDLINKLRGH
jgi:hypothetical protein